MIHPLVAGALTFLRDLLTSAPLINVAAQVTVAVLRLVLLGRGSLGEYYLLDATFGITTVGLLLDALEVFLPIEVVLVKEGASYLVASAATSPRHVLFASTFDHGQLSRTFLF